MYQRWGKRCLDLVLAGIGLIILLPLCVLIYILIYLFDHSNPLFLQPRPGLHGKIFIIIKFRTMTDYKSDPDKNRITGFGNFLRRTSLDEIPQLWNVIRGDMSIVGPRPLLPEYLPLYSQHQQLRHTVKPGITGWAQISGRNAIGWEQKLNLDVWYTQHISFLLDCSIIFKTVWKLLKLPTSDSREIEIPEKFNG
ncbi:MAG TPA: sugar transferase [Dyadobacter sp.]|jgi:lipopolysaccharide/colanic/teichoic acid biosynthesis glycosyltransferase|nr:sugar transferase [Dyadobacter sp.]